LPDGAQALIGEDGALLEPSHQETCQ
jgi:hypothetical protein